MTVFVSYSTRDGDTVKSLTQDLQDADEQVWLDQRLAGGDTWWRAILEQIRSCDVFAFALSQNSIESKPCQAELQYARALGLPILPVQVGPVDSMQLNPLATVQTVDYRSPTPRTAMRLIAALHRVRAHRQPLPSPLPDEPDVPFEYLIRLYTSIGGPHYLSPREQAALVAELQVGLREDGQHDAARKDIVMLLTKLHDREDANHRTRTDVDAILASIDAESGTHPPIATETAAKAEGQPGVHTSPVSTGPPADTDHEPANQDHTTSPDRRADMDLRNEPDDRATAIAPVDELTSSRVSRESSAISSVSPSETTADSPDTRPLRRRLSPHRKIALIAGVVTVAAGIIAAFATLAIDQHPSSTIPKTPAASQTPTSAPTASSELQIVIQNNRYSVPATVPPGTPVSVINKDPVQHNVVADEIGNGGFGPMPIFEWYLGPNSQRTLNAPEKPGNYSFHDEADPSMHGVLVVQ
jgi:plastocyanin